MQLAHKEIIRSAFILGSTTSVAKSICVELANKGCKRFHLLARDLESNKKLTNELISNYNAVVSEEKFNLLSSSCIMNASMRRVGEFDLYLITTGTLGDNYLARNQIQEAFLISETNYNSLIPWLTAIVTEDRINKPSRLWVFSSVAGDRGRPSNYHYGAAKAALTTLCEGILHRCHGKPFSTRIIKAGYIATPKTLAKAPKLLCTSSSRIAKILLKKPNRRGIEYLPFWWSIIMNLIKYLPDPLISRL